MYRQVLHSFLGLAHYCELWGNEMRVHQNHQSQIDPHSELLVIICIILVGKQCILGQGNLLVVLP